MHAYRPKALNACHDTCMQLPPCDDTCMQPSHGSRRGMSQTCVSAATNSSNLSARDSDGGGGTGERGVWDQQEGLNKESRMSTFKDPMASSYRLQLAGEAGGGGGREEGLGVRKILEVMATVTGFKSLSRASSSSSLSQVSTS